MALGKWEWGESIRKMGLFQGDFPSDLCPVLSLFGRFGKEFLKNEKNSSKFSQIYLELYKMLRVRKVPAGNSPLCAQELWDTMPELLLRDLSPGGFTNRRKKMRMCPSISLGDFGEGGAAAPCLLFKPHSKGWDLFLLLGKAGGEHTALPKSVVPIKRRNSSKTPSGFNIPVKSISAALPLQSIPGFCG